MLANEIAGNKAKSHNCKFRMTSNCCNGIVLKKVRHEIKNKNYDLTEKV